MATMDEMVEAVKAHAAANYNVDGWDNIVEAFEDAEVAEMLLEGKAKTVEEAIKVAHERVKLLDEHRKEIESTAW